MEEKKGNKEKKEGLDLNFRLSHNMDFIVSY